MPLRSRVVTAALALSLLASAAAACGDVGAGDSRTPTPPSPSVRLSSAQVTGTMEYAGTVTEAGGHTPLAGTTVELIATSADGTSEYAVGSVTAPDGSYAVSMDGAFVTANCANPCTFSMLVRLEGYELVRRPITFADGQHTLDVNLPRAG